MWLLEAFLHAPPISRNLAAISFIFSLLLFTGILDYSLFYLSIPALIQLPPEIWRLFTSLFITGRGLSLIFDVYFLYVYGAKLEIASPRFSQRADFVTYLGFSSCFILILNLFITSGHDLASPLALSVITTSVRDTWDQPITLFILTMPCQYLPYAFLLLNLILCGPHTALVHGTGLASAHLYDLLTGLYPSSGIERNFLPTPAWMMKVFGTQEVVSRPYGTVVTGATGKAAWGLDLSWKRFGPGRTLGGEGAEAERPKGLVLAAIVMGVFLVVCGVSGYLFVYGAPGWVSGANGGQLPGGTTHGGDGTVIP
ncbi:ER-associated proteolytic system protein-like protein Der1 [Rhexocercosporidium sp. MPI-PUGE-AT-0058]|nr:ER-associated proteolytic system protein-like protein Der1 [Rhexocercosporidium sp. MPI-PUGE-AT-0058]